MYKYLSWLDEYMLLREGKSNLTISEPSQETHMDYESGEEYWMQDSNNDAPNVTSSDRMPEDQESSSSTKTEKGIALKRKLKNSQQDEFKATELELMKNVSSALEQRSKVQRKEEDFIDLSLKSLGAEIRELSKIDQFMAFNEIRQFVFRYHIKRFGMPYPGTSSPPMTPNPQGPYVSELYDIPYISTPVNHETNQECN